MTTTTHAAVPVPRHAPETAARPAPPGVRPRTGVRSGADVGAPR
ncbi:hypothetical protein [Microbispora sp. H11081]|nr:hypothetical protein [Microbispora sp. H11081]